MLDRHESQGYLPDTLDSQYSQEILKLLERLHLYPTKYLSEGTINHGWLVQNHLTGEYQILVVGPLIGAESLSSAEDSGYLDSNKFTKAKKVTDLVLSLDVPAIRFFREGVVNIGELSFAWGLEEIAGGDPLSDRWSSLSHQDKLTIVEEIGTYMAKYQQVYSLEGIETPSSSQDWYLQRLNNLLLDAAKMQIFDDAAIARIKLAFKKILDESAPNNKMGLIHGDLFAANIFVKKDENKYRITNIIDWETATIGHIGYEQILSSWWMAGEREGDKEIFETIFKSCTGENERSGFENNVQSAITLVDMFWHINVIVSCTALNKLADVPRWKKNLLEIVTLIEQNKPYAIFSGE